MEFDVEFQFEEIGKKFYFKRITMSGCNQVWTRKFEYNMHSGFELQPKYLPRTMKATLEIEPVTGRYALDSLQIRNFDKVHFVNTIMFWRHFLHVVDLALIEHPWLMTSGNTSSGNFYFQRLKWGPSYLSTTTGVSGWGHSLKDRFSIVSFDHTTMTDDGRWKDSQQEYFARELIPDHSIVYSTVLFAL